MGCFPSWTLTETCIWSDAVISGGLISRRRQTNWKGLKEEQQNDYRPGGMDLWEKMKRTKYVKPN